MLKLEKQCLDESSESLDEPCNAQFNLLKSQSYDMILAHKRSASGSITNSRGDGRSTWTWGTVLGQGFSSPGKSSKFLSISPKSTKRNSQPQQSSSNFLAVLNGLRKCITATEESICSVKSILECSSVNSQQSQGKLYDSEKQLRSLERHQKHLEFQLSKFEELVEQYTLNEQLREGTRSMAFAYSQSTGKKRGEALNNVKSGFLECTETMSVLEGQIESLMGTFLIQIKGIQGFARLCVGDVYEITIKYGDQKWKSKGKVCKNNYQSWEKRKAMFKCLLGDVLLIKAVEVKMFGKHLLLGHKYFETKDLFSPFSQLLTISVNASGSLKLALVITWHPLDMTKEEIMTLGRPVPGQKSPKQKRPPLISVLGTELTIPHLTTSSSGSESVLSSGTDSLRSSIAECHFGVKTSVDSLGHDLATQSHHSSSSESVDYLDSSSNGKKMCVHFERNYTLQEYFDDCSCHKPPGKTTKSYSAGKQLPVVFLLEEISLMLSDLHGQHPELEALESIVSKLDAIVKVDDTEDDSASEYSISIESALQCFDFLNSEVDEDMEVDSGQGETVNNVNECHSLSAALVRDPALLYHLKYIKCLIQNLGMASPFQFVEVQTVNKLSKQAKILKLIIDQPTINFWEGTQFNYLEELWSNVTSKKSVMTASLSLFRSNLQPRVCTSLGVSQNQLVPGVIELLINLINDKSQCNHGEDPDDIITLYQLSLYEPLKKTSLDRHLQDLANEVYMEIELHSGDIIRVKHALDDFLRCSYLEVTIINLMLLLSEESQISHCVENVIRVSDPELKERIKCVSLTGLLSSNTLVKIGCCKTLKILEASDALAHLCHICQNDFEDKVRKAAKDTISSFGSESLNVLLNCELTNHGFQGLSTRF